MSDELSTTLTVVLLRTMRSFRTVSDCWDKIYDRYEWLNGASLSDCWESTSFRCVSLARDWENRSFRPNKRYLQMLTRQKLGRVCRSGVQQRPNGKSRKCACWLVFTEREKMTGRRSLHFHAPDALAEREWDERESSNLIGQKSRKFFPVMLDRLKRFNYLNYPSEITAFIFRLTAKLIIKKLSTRILAFMFLRTEQGERFELVWTWFEAWSSWKS